MRCSKRHKKSFQTEKKFKGIKYVLLRNIKNLFEYEKEEENHYSLVRVNNIWSKIYVEYNSNGDRNKALSVE